MSEEKEKPCLSDLGGLLQLFAGVLVLGAQISIYFIIQSTLIPFIPSFPIDIRPLYELIAQMMLIMIVVMVICGIVLIVAGVVSFFRSGVIGGFLSLFFGIAVIAAGAWMMFVVGFYPGIAHFAGAILAIVGGVLSIVPAVRGPPKPKTRREIDIRERQKKK
ncbi:MAG: hypothetical protein ACXACH_05620 [Candidatus Hermodarchaeia archaeon]